MRIIEMTDEEFSEIEKKLGEIIQKLGPYKMDPQEFAWSVMDCSTENATRVLDILRDRTACIASSIVTTQETKIEYTKCYHPTQCEQLIRGKYCLDSCKIEGCIRIDLSADTKKTLMEQCEECPRFSDEGYDCSHAGKECVILSEKGEN